MRLPLKFQEAPPEFVGEAAKIWHRCDIEDTAAERIPDATERRPSAPVANAPPPWQIRPPQGGDCAMNTEDAERWKELERRARQRGWTVDSLVHAHGPGAPPAARPAARKGAFALTELGGNERVLAS